MPRIISTLLIVLILTGCKTSFKSNFKDFNAYYNTFFNAKKSFELGKDKSENQVRNYNTLQPIRIYETPLGAGASDFQNAIDKGASILRKYDDTKWVDDALEIIGKSYFYRGEYFSADQKFDELYLSSIDVEMQQRAIFWKGRVLLELELYNQGVQYLTEQLALVDGEWKGDLEFQVMAVLAEHYVSRENWVNALDQLNTSISKLPSKAYKERGYFLIGQLNELIGDSEAAFEAYREVSKNYTNYDIQFESQKKQAEVARSLGNSDDAYKVFSKMVRDDKNSEFISELNFELGKTEQDRGNYRKAEDIYIRILQDKRAKTEAVTKARVYNGLAEINRYNYNNYQFAAAYYDSAARVNAPSDELPENFNAQEFANSFGDYTEIKTDIHLQDSLLWLGSLPQDEFDSVLVVLEEKKREELARLQKEQEDRRNTLINVNAPSGSNNDADNIERNGFLSYKNPVLLAETSQQFKALWNSRPLVDNWRLGALLIENVQAQEEENGDAEGVSSEASGQEFFVSIDLSQVPFTPQDQDSVKELISSLNYELANLFFLSLNLPDSAEIYFNKLLRDRPNSIVAPVSLYSLSELKFIEDEVEEAQSIAEELVQKFPNTVYADRVIEKYGIERPDVAEDVVIDLRAEYLEILNDSTIDYQTRAERLISYEEDNTKSELGAEALDAAIDNYIQLAKQDSNYTERIERWNQVNVDWNTKLEQFENEKDEAREFLQDTTISSTDSLMYETLLDSTLTAPDFKNEFPYQGVYWDSTRSKIDHFLFQYPVSSKSNSVKKLQTEFAMPVEEETEDESSNEEANAIVNTDYLSCDDIDQNVFIRGGLERFINQVEVPEGVQEDEISFLFFINTRGIIDEFQLSSETENQELIDAFVETIDEYVTFEPVLVEGRASAVSCEVPFPVLK